MIAQKIITKSNASLFYSNLLDSFFFCQHVCLLELQESTWVKLWHPLDAANVTLTAFDWPALPLLPLVLFSVWVSREKIFSLHRADFSKTLCCTTQSIFSIHDDRVMTDDILLCQGRRRYKTNQNVPGPGRGEQIQNAMNFSWFYLEEVSHPFPLEFKRGGL